MPKILSPAANPNNLKDLCNGNFYTIAEINDIKGSSFCIAQVINQLINVFEFYSVGKSPGEDQIKETAFLIMQNYPDLSIPDLQMCFTWAKLGKLPSSQLFDRIDGAIILKWIFEFQAEKKEYLVRKNRQSIPDPPKKLNNDEKKQIEDIIADIKNRLKEKIDREKRIFDDVKPQNKSEFDFLVQKWIKRFQKISDDQGLNNQIRYIKKGKKIYSLDEFLNNRINIYNQWKNRKTI